MLSYLFKAFILDYFFLPPWEYNLAPVGSSEKSVVCYSPSETWRDKCRRSWLPYSVLCCTRSNIGHEGQTGQSTGVHPALPDNRLNGVLVRCNVFNFFSIYSYIIVGICIFTCTFVENNVENQIWSSFQLYAFWLQHLFKSHLAFMCKLCFGVLLRKSSLFTLIVIQIIVIIGSNVKITFFLDTL